MEQFAAAGAGLAADADAASAARAARAAVARLIRHVSTAQVSAASLRYLGLSKLSQSLDFSARDVESKRAVRRYYGYRHYFASASRRSS